MKRRGRHPRAYALSGAEAVKAALANGAKFGTAPRRVQITKYGCEDVRGAHCTWTVADRTYLGEVINIYRDETRGCWVLQCKHMDGSPTPEVAASFVTLLERTYDNGETE